MEARLRYGVHHLAENRHHLVVAVMTERLEVTRAMMRITLSNSAGR